MKTFVSWCARLPRPGRSTVWLALIVAAAVFVTVIPTAWATPDESPLNQTMPTIPPAPAPPSPGGDAEASMPPAMPPVPHGGHLYYYVVGYGGIPSNYYPGYTTGEYWYPRAYNFYYPSGLYTPAPPVYSGYRGYYGVFW